MLAIGCDSGCNLAEDSLNRLPLGKKYHWVVSSRERSWWPRRRNPLSYCSDSTPRVYSIVPSPNPFQLFVEEFPSKKTINLAPEANWNQ